MPTVSQQRGKTDTTNKCLGYDIKQSDGEALVLKIQGCGVPSALPLIPGHL